MDKLIEEGEKIAQENLKIQNEMLKACRSVSTAGVCMYIIILQVILLKVHGTPASYHVTQYHDTPVSAYPDLSLLMY